MKRFLSMCIMTAVIINSFIITAYSENDVYELHELCLVDSNGKEVTEAHITSEDDRLYLNALIENKSSVNKKIRLIISGYKDKKQEALVQCVQTIKSGETLEIGKEKINELAIDVITGKNVEYKVFVWDAETNAPITENKVYKNKEKIIFIGNSLTYYGGVVADGTQNTSDAYLEKRFGDEGYFYQMAKQNNIEMDVTNWTWGGHGIDDIFGESCAADRGHDGHNHYADFKRLSDMDYDYIVLQPTNRTALTKEALKEQIQMVKEAFAEKSPDAKYFVLIPATYYINDTTAKKTFRECFPEVEEEKDVKIITWGKLVSDIIDGKTVVENSSQTYNKNTFIISASASDGYHPNQLTGYITTQFVFSAITGKKSVGENYSFCTDNKVNSWFDVNEFLRKFYIYDNISAGGNLRGDSLTNYPEIFKSATDMVEIQKLIDKHMENGIIEIEESNVKNVIFIGNSLTYVGQTVLDAKQQVDNASVGARFGDTGYFYNMAKQNNVEMNVTNWTWGGHSLSHMFSESCSANRGHDGHNHLEDLKKYSDMKYDYVVYQPTNSFTLSEEALVKDIEMLKSIFSKENPDVKYFIAVPTTYYIGDNSEKETFRNAFLKIEEETEVEIVQWGKLISDIIDGIATVENSSQTYNKNTFLISASSSDGYNPNQLAGYITTQFLFSAITGEKAEGEDYAFCTDSKVNSVFDVNRFLSIYYTYDNISASGNLRGDSLTTYPEIFKSSTDMIGIQRLIDKYLE